MYTTIKYGTSIMYIATQSYITSTYICVYVNNRPVSQFCTSMNEVQYHKHIRINAIKNNLSIVDGTILDCKSKYEINKFNK